MSSRKFCPHCGKTNLPFAKFCSGCGYEIPKSQIVTEVKESPETYVVRTVRRKSYKRLIILIVIGALFIFTNPNKEMHQDWARVYLIEKQNQNSYGDLSLLGIIFQGINTELTVNSLKRVDYVFFSLTEFEYKGQSKKVAIGILSNLFELEKIENYLRPVGEFIEELVE